MEIVVAEKMREIDNFCIENLGIPSMVLMENAALKVLNNIELDKYEDFIIISGSGNNGGDGLALARHLHVLEKKVEVFIIGQKDKLSKDCQENYKILINMGIDIKFIEDYSDINDLEASIDKHKIIVDSIFGTGLSREVKGVHEQVILLVNKRSSYVISIDVPSGLNSDTGEILGCCIKANKTISFQYFKRGFLRYGIEKYTGEIVIENIGIPKFIGEKFLTNEHIIEPKMVKRAIPIRKKYSHKGTFGRVSIVAGSQGFTGAAFISTESAVRSGAGLVTLCCNESIQDIMSSKLVEAMTVSFKNKEKLNEVLSKSDAIAVGPGMGNNDGTLKIVKDIIQYTKCPLVIDADGINVLKNNLNLLKEKNKSIVLTPHLGEMSTITGIPVDKIERNRVDIAKAFAKEYNVILLLKGYNTIITDGETVMVNTTGNSAMASGGMGDCLTGIITSLIAQGLSEFEAAYVGAYIHGYCGDKLAVNKYCVNASHMLDEIPEAIKEIQTSL